MQQWVIEHGWLDRCLQRALPAVQTGFVPLCRVVSIAGTGRFSPIWRVFMIATLIATPWYALYPLAPPRLMTPFGFPFVDTLAVYGEAVSSTEGVGGANQFAAMPSMHIGWTTIAALWLAAALPWWRIGAILGTVHVGLMCVTVVVTGNHYVLDIVAGFAVAGLAVLIERSASNGVLAATLVFVEKHRCRGESLVRMASRQSGKRTIVRHLTCRHRLWSIKDSRRCTQSTLTIAQHGTTPPIQAVGLGLTGGCCWHSRS